VVYPARRRSPIPVLTGLNVEQLRSYDERRYRSAKPPTSRFAITKLEKLSSMEETRI